MHGPLAPPSAWPVPPSTAHAAPRPRRSSLSSSTTSRPPLPQPPTRTLSGTRFPPGWNGISEPTSSVGLPPLRSGEPARYVLRSSTRYSACTGSSSISPSRRVRGLTCSIRPLRSSHFPSAHLSIPETRCPIQPPALLACLPTTPPLPHASFGPASLALPRRPPYLAVSGRRAFESPIRPCGMGPIVVAADSLEGRRRPIR